MHFLPYNKTLEEFSRELNLTAHFQKYFSGKNSELANSEVILLIGKSHLTIISLISIVENLIW